MRFVSISQEKSVKQNERKETMMQLVEKHVIRQSDPRFAVIDQAAFASKNRDHSKPGANCSV